jgi:hypothetical protein
MTTDLPLAALSLESFDSGGHGINGPDARLLSGEELALDVLGAEGTPLLLVELQHGDL